MIVVAIIAMVSAGVAVVAVRQASKARLTHAETNARSLRNAIQSFQALEASSECPSFAQLEGGGFIDEASSREDPWGEKWKISCLEDHIEVASAGPDGTIGSEDDICVPECNRSAADDD